MSKLVGLLTASLGGFLILMEDTVVEFLLLKPPGLLGGFLPLTEVFLLSLMLISLEIDKKKFHFGKFLKKIGEQIVFCWQEVDLIYEGVIAKS